MYDGLPVAHFRPGLGAAAQAGMQGAGSSSRFWRLSLVSVDGAGWRAGCLQFKAVASPAVSVVAVVQAVRHVDNSIEFDVCH